MQMYGIAFDRPMGHLREYLAVLRTLLAEGTWPTTASATR